MTSPFFGDKRGYFAETYRASSLEAAIGYSVDFVQDSESKSARNVFRGLHYQRPPFAQSKLVRVVMGKVLDIVVDIRSGSPTYGRALSIILSSEKKQQLFIPRGFAHGFLTLSDYAIMGYKLDNYYAPEYEQGISYQDASLGIDWQNLDTDLIASAKDQDLPLLDQLQTGFNYLGNH